MKKLIFLTLTFFTSAAFAVGEKDDICHREGNGLYHMVNVSTAAFPAHLNHGDLLPNSNIPSMPGKKVNENCEIVDVPSCPCDFSIPTLAELGFDGASLYVCWDTIDSNTLDLLRIRALDEETRNIVYGVEFIRQDVRDCATLTNNGNLRITGLTDEELESCRGMLNDAILEFDIPPC